MRVVLVSSPGDPDDSAAGHWSHAAAAELARVLSVGGVSVEWFRVAHASTHLPSPPPGASMHTLATKATPLDRVARAGTDLALEVALTRSLRVQHAEVVVHLGAGARGSPNVCWIADRMGSVPVAVLRSNEVVCHRGTLIDADHRPCSIFDDAERCRDCCAQVWWRRIRPTEFTDRLDLLLGSLTLATSVFVATAAEIERLASLGINRRVVMATHEAEAIADRLRRVPAAMANG